MIAFLLVSTPALADYIAPPPAKMLEQSTSILDATVVRFDADGHAVLDVHQVLAGRALPELEGVALSCTGGSPELFGVEAGKRYVFLADGRSMFEEQTFFEVRGDLEVRFWTLRGETWERSWQPMGRVKAAVVKHRR